MKLLLYLNLLISLFAHAVLGTEAPKNFVQSGCKITDDLGVARFGYSADICLFLPDGSFISFAEKEKLIQKINPDNKVVWKKNAEKIRSVVLSFDKKSLLVLSSMVKKNLYCKAKTDIVERISVSSGKTLARLNADEVIDLMVMGRGSVPILLPVKQNDSEAKNSYDCTFPSFAAVTEITGESKKYPTSQLLGSLVLYTEPTIRGNYILSHDFKKVVWSTAQPQRNETTFQNIIFNDYIYVVSILTDTSEKIRIKKINFQNKKPIWFKDLQLDAGFRPIYYSAIATTDQLILQTSNEDNSQFIDYEFDNSGNLIEKKSSTMSAANLQSKLISDFLKNRGNEQ